ncbi:MAG: hypothetical protein AAB281_06045 [Actinomycetota bacterium]
MKTEEVLPVEQIAAPTGGDNLSSQIEGLKSQEMTVEVVANGKSAGTWSQKEGSWRWEDPSSKDKYIIFNAKKNKMWNVSGNTATELDTSMSSQYMGFSPESYLKMYSMLPATNRTGDTWEFDMPGQGKLSIEFKGPQGLPTKLETTDASTGKTDVVEFKYSNVGSVSDSLFELPAGVTVTPGIDYGGGSVPTVPGGGSVPTVMGS